MQALYHATLHPKVFRHSPQPMLFYDPMEPDTIFSPQVVLPEQFYRSSALASKNYGEVALMHAVLKDAIECFRKQFISQRRRDQRLAREAEEWFLTDDDCWPFSFVNICTVLRLDPEYIRARLNRWRQYAQPHAKGSARRTVQRYPSLRLAS